MPKRPKKQPDISILIPFSSNNKDRREVFRWVVEYWENELPDAEIVIGHSSNSPFSKTEAINRAVYRSNGKVLVMADSDAYLTGDVIKDCAEQILADTDKTLWFVPYRKLYRLNEEITAEIIESDPANPFYPPDPPPDDYLDGEPDGVRYGRRYAALMYIIPRDAYDAIGCLDERFAGWGGEDISTLRTFDTLYGKHKTTDNGIFHLWHPKIGDTFQTRRWEGQGQDEPNKQLALRYYRALGNPEAMREIVDEGCRIRDAKLAQGIVWQGFDEWMVDLNSHIIERFRKTKWWK